MRKALTLNFATSSTILIGAIGGFFVLELLESFEGPLLAVATGGVLSVVFYDLIPHSMRNARTKNYWVQHVAWFVCGCALMYGVTTLVPHQEPESASVVSTGSLSL